MVLGEREDVMGHRTLGEMRRASLKHGWRRALLSACCGLAAIASTPARTEAQSATDAWITAISGTLTLRQTEVSAAVAALALIEAVLIGALWLSRSRRRRAEQALRASEGRHRALLKVIPDLIFVLSRDGVYLDYHAKSPDDLFVPPESFLGKNMRDIMPPHLDALIRQRFDEVLTTGEPALAEYTLPMSGGEKHFEARIVQRDDGDFVSIVRDITDRKRVAEQLRKSEEFNRRIIENSPECIKILEPDGVLTYMSPAGMRMLELEELIKGTNILDYLGPQDRAEGVDALARARAGDIGTFHGMVLTRSGREKWVDAVVSPMLDANGKVESLLAVSRDVTERRAADEALGETRAQVARLNRAMTLGALTSSIAHELRQPLAAILLNTASCRRYLSARPADLDGVSDCLMDVERDATRASEIISHIRTLITRTPTQRSPLDLNAAIGEVVELVRDDVASAGVMLTTELESELPKVEGDRVQLQQVLLNLIRNGVEAMRDAGDSRKRLVIRSLRSTPSIIEVDVSDSGVGLEPGAEDRIFDAFYTTKTDGTGLGLAMSRTIVEAHGGRLWAATNADGGATFRFALASAQLPEALSTPSLPQATAHTLELGG
jgi:PAS domain S-box-containing protein